MSIALDLSLPLTQKVCFESNCLNENIQKIDETRFNFNDFSLLGSNNFMFLQKGIFTATLAPKLLSLIFCSDEKGFLFKKSSNTSSTLKSVHFKNPILLSR